MCHEYGGKHLCVQAWTVGRQILSTRIVLSYLRGCHRSKQFSRFRRVLDFGVLHPGKKDTNARTLTVMYSRGKYMFTMSVDRAFMETEICNQIEPSTTNVTVCGIRRCVLSLFLGLVYVAESKQTHTPKTRSCSFRVPLSTREGVLHTPHGALKRYKSCIRTEKTWYTDMRMYSCILKKIYAP